MYSRNRSTDLPRKSSTPLEFVLTIPTLVEAKESIPESLGVAWRTAIGAPRLYDHLETNETSVASMSYSLTWRIVEDMGKVWLQDSTERLLIPSWSLK